MRIKARECRFTGKIFKESEIEDYRNHLIDLRKGMREERAYAERRNSFKSWLAESKRTVTDVSMIPKWFLENQKDIMAGVNALDGRESFVTEDTFTQFYFEWVKFSKNVSNTHVCPDSGVTNFTKAAGLPTGYVGWAGGLGAKLIRPEHLNYKYPYTAAFNLVGIKTGTGGGGNTGIYYSFSIFLDDWPGLITHVRKIEEDEIVAKLKG